MGSEREIDIAVALDGMSGVVGVYALRVGGAGSPAPTHLAFAIALRPKRPLAIAEAHYRLLQVLPYEECGRVLFFDADERPPRPLAGAERITVSSAERTAATIRAMARVEITARRHGEAEVVTLKSVVALALESDEQTAPNELHVVLRRAHTIALALHDYMPVTDVFVVEDADPRAPRNLDVFVEVRADATFIAAAHARVVRGIGGGSGPVLYGDFRHRTQFRAQRVRLSGSDYVEARRRREARPSLHEGPDARALEEHVADFFARGRPEGPIRLDLAFARKMTIDSM